MKRLAFVLKKIFEILFIVFSVGVLASAFLGVDSYEKSLAWKISSIIVILFFVFIICCTINSSEQCLKKEKYKNIVSLFVLSLCMHLLIVWALGQYTEQISDFASAFMLSQKSFPLTETPDHYRIFSNWAIYPLYLRTIQKMFGYGAFTGIIFNAIVCALSTTLIYILCNLVIKNDRIGYLAALIYTFWPSHLLYSIILTPEFLNIFFTLLFGCCMLMTISYYDRKIVYVLTGLSAAILALSGFFKSIDKIVLIALGIIIVLDFLNNEYLKSLDQEKVRSLCKRVLILIVFVGSYFGANRIIFSGLDYAYGGTINRNPSANFIYIGLNPDTYGTWNAEAYNVYSNNVLNCNYDYERASDLTYQQLINEIRNKKYLTATYFKEKFKIAWENNAETYWVNETLIDESPFLKKPTWFFAFGMLTQNFWVVICIFMCMEAVSLFFYSDSNRMFICLIIFGFACLMLLSEVQGRYKCVMYPFISILVADGIIRIEGMLRSIYRRRYHMQ